MDNILKSVASNALLSYSVSSFPTPIQVSPENGDLSYATLSLVVSNNTDPEEKIYCNKVVLEFSVGQEARDFTDDVNGIAVSVIPADKWQISNNGDGSFTATPRRPNDNLITTEGLAFRIQNIKVNKKVGTFALLIVETSSKDNQQFTDKNENYNIGKFPYGFNFAGVRASVPQINRGGGVTLSWSGSSNTSYILSYADKQLDVSDKRSWQSSPLYSTTAFTLRASTSQGGETVSLEDQVVVIVAAPEVISFDADPDYISYNEEVVLNWRAIDADGVYFRIGQSSREELPAVSNQDQPKTIVPVYGTNYIMQAFKKGVNGSRDMLSQPYPLQFSFKALNIKRFTADPAVVDLNNQSTILSWDVEHAKSVSLKNKEVPAIGTQEERPTARSTVYSLRAAWVDDSVITQTVDVTVLRVKYNGFRSSYSTRGSTITVVFDFDVKHATSGRVTDIYMGFSTHRTRHGEGNQTWTGKQTVNVIKIRDNHWRATVSFSVSSEWFNAPNIGIFFGYVFSGFHPVSNGWNRHAYKGYIDLIDLD